MLEPTKKHHIEITFKGPIGKRAKAVKAMQEMGFVENEDTIDWREAFPALTDERLPGVCLKGARTKEGITQKELAVMTGIKQHHISEMENHKRAIGKKNAMKFAKILDIDYRVFL